MEKLLRGLLEFQNQLTEQDRERFAKLALGQKPDALMIACSDSRVAPNVFASTAPGDLFVVRNVGNLVPPFTGKGVEFGAFGTGAALEFALTELGVSDLIVCGHSECGAMIATASAKKLSNAPFLDGWLAHSRPSMQKLRSGFSLGAGLAEHNQLSQVNVMQQLAHLRSYPLVKELEEKGKLRLHGWWFDIAHCQVHVIDEALKRVDPIDAEQVRRISDRLGKKKNS